MSDRVYEDIWSNPIVREDRVLKWDFQLQLAFPDIPKGIGKSIFDGNLYQISSDIIREICVHEKIEKIFFRTNQSLHLIKWNDKFICFNFNQDVYICIIFHLCKFSDKECESRWSYYENLRESLDSISKRFEQIDEYERQILKRMSALTKYTPKDFSKAIKIAKKLKMEAEELEDGYKISFNNVICGNDIEGYIKYKRIELFLKENWNLDKVNYQFSDFEWKSDFYYELDIANVTLHPHISGMRGICYGNRKNDYLLYSSTHDYAGLFTLLKETVYNYTHEEGFKPFRSVSEINETLKQVKAAKKYIENSKAEMSAISNENLSSRLWELRQRYFSVSCPYCGEGVDSRTNSCQTENCLGNIEAIIHCPSCGVALSHTNNRRCHNPECCHYNSIPPTLVNLVNQQESSEEASLASSPQSLQIQSIYTASIDSNIATEQTVYFNDPTLEP